MRGPVLSSPTQSRRQRTPATRSRCAGGDEKRRAGSGLRKQFRGDAGFARPEIHECLEEHDFLDAIRLPANAVLERKIEPHVKRPEALEPGDPVVTYRDLLYQAGPWDRPRRVVSKIEWHAGELFPRGGFIVTNRTDPAKGIARLYNGRGSRKVSTPSSGCASRVMPSSATRSDLPCSCWPTTSATSCGGSSCLRRGRGGA
ncbi:MAG: hypothetical protein FJZ97_14150 [Chloroflexi bacterium]|nr:hypothetical protein [Chloroflexota bacterium]